MKLLVSENLPAITIAHQKEFAFTGKQNMYTHSIFKLVLSRFVHVSCVDSILIGRFSIFRFKHFDDFDIRVQYKVFRHKLSLKVCFRFIFGFDIV